MEYEKQSILSNMDLNQAFATLQPIDARFTSSSWRLPITASNLASLALIHLQVFSGHDTFIIICHRLFSSWPAGS